MKKPIFGILFLVFIFIMTFAIVSCGKDDKFNQGKEPQKPSEIELPIVEC